MRALQHAGVLIATVLFIVGLWPGSLLAQGTARDRAILLYQRMLQRNPHDARTYYRLGDAYIQKAREGGDVTYFNLAEQALRKVLEIAPRHSGAFRHLAYVLYSRHEFQEAALQAARAVELDATNGDGYGVLGDAYLEVGKYEEAQEAYRRMIQIRADLYSYSRLAGLKSLRGDTKGAIEDLERAIQEGKANGRPTESIAWVQWQLGSDHFAVGNLKDAEAHYLEALKTYPNYYRASAGLAQVRAAQKEYAVAVELYLKALAVIPLPEYAAALGDLYAKLGRHEEGKKQYELVEYIGYLNTVNKILYNRELAYFYADHDMTLDKSLDLAKKELEYRRDIYAYDVLAWALYKNDKPREALAAMTEALKLGTRDSKLLFHAGMIYHRLGEAGRAQEYLRRALSTNPHFHILLGDVAERTLGELEGRPGPAAIETKRDGP